MSEKQPGCFESDLVMLATKKWAGHYFKHMLDSYEVTSHHLTHPDPQARLGALAMIRDYWSPPSGFQQLCEKMAVEDEDVRVRCFALNCLISFYYGTWDSRVGKRIAEIVCDDKQPILFRKVAYLVLFAVRAVELPPDTYALPFPEHVDWSFVNSFFDGSGQEKESRVNS